MTNFDPSTLDWTSGLLAGWKYEKPVNKWFQGGFRSAHRLTRPCPTCAETIVLDVTTKALTGDATNHGLSLRRCKECRVALKRTGISGEYAVSKMAGEKRHAAEPERIAAVQPVAVESTELAELKQGLKEAYDAIMEVSKKFGAVRKAIAEELGLDLMGDGITYETVKAKIRGIRKENEDLRARLAKFELQPAMEALKKMPWG
jgi:hypothetical protein